MFTYSLDLDDSTDMISVRKNVSRVVRRENVQLSECKYHRFIDSHQARLFSSIKDVA